MYRHHRSPDPRPLILLSLLAMLLFAPGLAAAATAAPGEKTVASAQSPVDINRASLNELISLKGIGPALAGRIVAYRQEHGAFRRVEDLLEVKGIGPKLLARLKPHLKVSPQAAKGSTKGKK